ncbi:hypothetical protein KP004_05675 [Geomonas oryzisoli]|uniref:Uncharacterized protein n=1 Tax=Geomonas oryzisoli TaxID=2847992 RepID=A0ABX8J8K8_9BACT|nr:hypothetical protein [Geomonas oryzisoli]QWV94668.1 hypothetical protein KP004_05675 [Geomonas oryzisoli]
MISVPKGYRCPLCPEHQDDEDDFCWSDLLQAPVCHSCTYEIVNGFEGWSEAPTPDQYNHTESITRIMELTGLTFQQAKFKFMRRHVSDWAGTVPEEMQAADLSLLTDDQLKEWNAILDAAMLQLRSQADP